MKEKIFTMTMAMVMVVTMLILPAIIFAQANQTATTMTTTTTTTTGISLPSLPTSLKEIYNFFSGINPFILLIFGLVILVVAKLAKYVAIALVIFALIQIILLLVR